MALGIRKPDSTDPPGFREAAGRADERYRQGLVDENMSRQAQAFDYFAGISGFDSGSGTTALGEDRLGRYEEMQGHVLADRDLGVRYLQGGYDSDLARLGLSREELGIDQAEAARRLGGGGYYDQLLGLIDQGLDVRMRGFDIDESEANRKGARAKWLQMSDATGRGAVTSEGNRLALGDINQALVASLGQIGLGREAAGIGAERERLNLKESKEQERARSDKLGLKARELNLDQADLERELKRGIEKLNLGAYMSVNDLLDKMNSTRFEDRMVAEQIYRDVLQYSDLFPSSPPTARTISSDSGRQASSTGYRR